MWKQMMCWGVMVMLCSGCIHVKVGDVSMTEDLNQDTATGFIHLSTEVNGEERRGMVYVPMDYDPKQTYPLIVFLHGLGESGSDGVAQTTVGIGNAIRNHPERFPCIVYMPQSPKKVWWNSVAGRKSASDSFDHITQGIERVLAQYSVDENRVSLTGLSMGGFGTFAYGSTHPARFSAFMPICGGGNAEAVAPGLAQRPMWVFHGESDDVVSVTGSKEIVEATRAAGGSVKFTTYPGVGHNSWDKAYGPDEQAIEWLLEQQR